MIPVLAILAIAGVEAFAIAHGIDGKALVATVGALSAIAGYYYHKGRHAKDNTKD